MNIDIAKKKLLTWILVEIFTKAENILFPHIKQGWYKWQLLLVVCCGSQNVFQ